MYNVASHRRSRSRQCWIGWYTGYLVSRTVTGGGIQPGTRGRIRRSSRMRKSCRRVGSPRTFAYNRVVLWPSVLHHDWMRGDPRRGLRSPAPLPRLHHQTNYLTPQSRVHGLTSYTFSYTPTWSRVAKYPSMELALQYLRSNSQCF